MCLFVAIRSKEAPVAAERARETEQNFAHSPPQQLAAASLRRRSLALSRSPANLVHRSLSLSLVSLSL